MDPANRIFGALPTLDAFLPGFLCKLGSQLSGWVIGNVLVKFGLVSIATIILSYLVSRYMIKPYPRAFVIGLIGLNLLLVVFS